MKTDSSIQFYPGTFQANALFTAYMVNQGLNLETQSTPTNWHPVHPEMLAPNHGLKLSPWSPTERFFSRSGCSEDSWLSPVYSYYSSKGALIWAIVE